MLFSLVRCMFMALICVVMDVHMFFMIMFRATLQAWATEDIAALKTERKKLKKEKQELEEEVRKWRMFWAWTSAKAFPKTLLWLQKELDRAPRRKHSPDGGWGGGQ